VEKTLKKHSEKIRFTLVGGINTAIDFVVLFVLFTLGLPIIVSNFISTSTALIFSFLANKKYTFRDSNIFNKNQFTAFLVITLIGLWILHPVIISIFNPLLISYQFDKNISLFFSKVIATLVTLAWNYLLYREFVFKKDKL
jgi:putative flippase GtrA